MSPDQSFICKSSLGGLEFLGISKVGQRILARLTESQIWHQLASSVQEGLRERKWPLPTFMPATSVTACIPQVPFKLPPQYWNSEGVGLIR